MFLRKDALRPEVTEDSNFGPDAANIKHQTWPDATATTSKSVGEAKSEGSQEHRSPN